MYFLKDKRSYYRAIQCMLGIKQSGVWDKATVDTINRVLNERDIKWDGVVDNRVFDILKEIYQKRIRYGKYTEMSAQVGFGDSGEGIVEINNLLGTVLMHYTGDLRAPKGRFISIDSLRAAGYLRGIYMLSEGDFIDDELLYYLNMDYSRIKRLF